MHQKSYSGYAICGKLTIFVIFFLNHNFNEKIIISVKLCIVFNKYPVLEIMFETFFQHLVAFYSKVSFVNNNELH